MTDQQLLQTALQSLHLADKKQAPQHHPDQGASAHGQAQGQALLKLLQGQVQQNGYGQEAAGLVSFGGRPAPALPPYQQPGGQPEQAVSSLFGAAGGSIWSNGSGAQDASHPGSSLWGNPPPQGGWQAAQSLQPSSQPQHALLQNQQPQQQHAGNLSTHRHQPSDQLPMHFGQHQQHSAPGQQPSLHAMPALQQPAGPPSLRYLQHQQLPAQPAHMPAQPVQHELHIPAAAQHPPHPHAPAPQHHQAPRPVTPYNPLSALLQPHSLQPVPQQLQQQLQHQQQQHQQQPQMQQQQSMPPGVHAGPWGPAFAGLPAMQHLQQQQQQQQLGSNSQPFPRVPGPLPPPHGPAAGAQLQPPAPHLTQGPPPHLPALFNGLPQGAALAGLQAAPSASAHSPPPPPDSSHAEPSRQQGQAGSRPNHQPSLAQKLGTQPKSGPGRENRWVDVMDRSHDGRHPKADMQQLDAALTQLADSLLPTPEEHAAQMDAFDSVRSLLVGRYPGARVHLFGSVANGLSVRHNNDIDVCLELEGVDDQAAKSEVAEAVGGLMESAGMAEVLTLPRARVPVVKFVFPRTGTKVDVTVNNLLACVNTKLLADYCAIDARLAPLVALVKHWAKQRAVNDPYRGTLSSYCYVLMCIHLLQTRPVPVLPVLQQLPPTFHRTVGQWACEFCDDVEQLRGFGAANSETLAQLVWAFFEYWAWGHDYARDVVSVRLGGRLHKDDKDWTRRIGNERHLLCIEDPFELSHDLGRTVDRQTRAVLHKEFTRAATLLRDAADPLDTLFQPYRTGGRA